MPSVAELEGTKCAWGRQGAGRTAASMASAKAQKTEYRKNSPPLIAPLRQNATIYERPLAKKRRLHAPMSRNRSARGLSYATIDR